MTNRPARPSSVGPRTQCYLVEVRLQVPAGTDLSWIRQSLNAACRRLTHSGPRPRILSAVHIPNDGRLSCVVRAAGREDVHRLFEIALLSSARIVEAVVVPEMAPGDPI